MPGGLSDAGAAGREPPPPDVLPDGSPIPAPSLVLLLSGPLPPDIPVRVEIEGVTNLHGLAGGGALDVLWTPEPPDSLPPESLAPDMVGPVPDTGGVATDTLGAPFLLPALRPRS